MTEEPLHFPNPFAPGTGPSRRPTTVDGRELAAVRRRLRDLETALDVYAERERAGLSEAARRSLSLIDGTFACLEEDLLRAAAALGPAARLHAQIHDTLERIAPRVERWDHARHHRY
jgi:hypothetical protein